MPILSILIPTKDNHLVLNECINSLSFFLNHPDVEIIVHDNSQSEINGKTVAEKYKYVSNLHYIFCNSSLSQAENFDAVSSYAQGRFQTLIGDDDSIFPSVINIVNYMDRNNLDASFTGFSSYIWPGVIKDGSRGEYTQGKISEVLLNNTDSKKELNKVIKGGCVSMGNLPRIYYGIVRTSVIKKIRKRNNTAFPGPSPDMANAVAVAIEVNKYLSGDFPVFIAGNSKNSNAAKGLKKKHVGNLDEQSFLPENILEIWPKILPLYWSGPTIWAASALLVMQKYKYNATKKFNISLFFAHEFVYNHNVFLKHVSKYKVLINPLVVYFIIYKIINRALYFISSRFFKNKKQDIETLSEVIEKFSAKLDISVSQN